MHFPDSVAIVVARPFGGRGLWFTVGWGRLCSAKWLYPCHSSVLMVVPSFVASSTWGANAACVVRFSTVSRMQPLSRPRDVQLPGQLRGGRVLSDAAQNLHDLRRRTSGALQRRAGEDIEHRSTPMAAIVQHRLAVVAMHPMLSRAAAGTHQPPLSPGTNAAPTREPSPTILEPSTQPGPTAPATPYKTRTHHDQADVNTPDLYPRE